MLLILQILIISFFLNLLWEVLHSQLYTTCIKASLKKYIPLITLASVKDAFWITLFFIITTITFKNTNILNNPYQLILFITLAISFSFFDERISIKRKRWEYTKQMPVVFGVGITPLLELAVTGTLTFLYVFLI